MTPTHNDRSTWANLPVWAKAASIYGVPAVIAMYLVFELAAGVKDDVQATRALMVDHARESAAVTVRLERLLEVQTDLLRQMCVNTATTVEDRRGCFP